MKRAVVLLGLSAVIAGQVVLRSRFAAGGPLIVGMWLIGVGLLASFALPAGGARTWRSGRRDLPRRMRPPAGELLILLAIVVIALGLRLYGLRDFPPGCHIDEADNGLLAQRLLQGGWFPVYTEVGNGKATLHFYFIALAFRLLGVSTWSIRVVSAIVGALSIIPFYFLARAGFGPATGLAASFVLAVSRWHITFSRVGYDAVLAILFAVFVFLFLFVALEYWKRRDFVLGGAFLGLGLYTYMAFRLIPAAIAGVLLREAVVEWRRLRAHMPAVVTGAAVALIVVAPLGLYAATHWDIFMFRTGQVYLGSHVPGDQFLPALWENVKMTLRMFNLRGDGNGRHNLPDAPMLDDISAGLMLLGVLLLVRRIHERAAFLFLLWFGVMLLPGILSIEAPQALRNSGTIPALALCVGLSIARFGQFMRRGRGSISRIIGIAVPVALLLGIAALNVDAYFRKQATSPRVWESFDLGETGVGRHVKRSIDRASVFVDASYWGYPVIRFEAGEGAEYLPFRTADLPLTQDLFLLPPVPTYRSLLEAYYPEGRGQEFRDPFERPLYVAFEVSRDQVIGSQGLVATCTPRDRSEGEEALVKRTPGVEIPAGLSADREYRGRWEGSIVIREDGRYAFGARSTIPVSITVGGREVYWGFASPRGPRLGRGVLLARGTYSFVARSPRIGAEDEIEVVWEDVRGDRGGIPVDQFFVRSFGHGLLGTYWQDASWEEEPEGEPGYRRVDPEIYFYWHIPPFMPRGPFRVEWIGEIDIERPGEYRFKVEAIDVGQLWIDGEQLLGEASYPGERVEGMKELTAGRHQIRMRLASVGSYPTMRLWWIPPEGEESVVPWSVFYPPPPEFVD